MLTLDYPLPRGALCDDPAATLAQDLLRTGVMWWDGTGLRTDKTGAVTEWSPRLGTHSALPTTPNDGNGLIGEAGDFRGLQCQQAVHCGMAAENVAEDASRATLAIRYLAPAEGDARTLLTYNASGTDRKGTGANYLFLSEADGVLTVKDDNGAIELTLPVPGNDFPRLVLISLDGPHLMGKVADGDSASARADTRVLNGAASLFIGCRNQRPKLFKTLGAALISDVWLWPGRALLPGQTDTDRHALRALLRFLKWSEDA